MRELKDMEISILEDQGCTAEDWNEVLVSEDFVTDSIHNTSFYGHIEIGSMMGTIEMEPGFRRRCGVRNATLRDVSIGDDCLIDNIHGYISGYSIGDHCLLSDIGTMTCQEDATFGSGTTISVLNEGGDGNVTLSEDLTAQVAWIAINSSPSHPLPTSPSPSLPTIGSYSRIVNVREVINIKTGEYCEINGASRLDNCTLMSSEDASTFIGSDVIIESSIVADGASVTDGAKVYECFVGESVHIGKGFSAESSLFFANSHMDNGEACAALCGPFSTSHHKSTLLIGGAFSFYNAGSGTNQSNHAYKMGPIHWGILDRGAKTASGCHILWPAHIGAFSMAMGKIQTHPQVYKLPFSYVIAEGEKTHLVPGINIRTVGTWRDVGKWQKRDLRPESSCGDLINFAFPNPYIIQNILEGKRILTTLLEEHPEDDLLEYGNTVIKRSSAEHGIEYYDLITRLFLFEYFSDKSAKTDEISGEKWLDVCGMLAPEGDILRIMHNLKSGAICDTSELREALCQTHSDYAENAAKYANHIIRQMGGDRDKIRQEAEEAHARWLDMIRQDAGKEYRMGDVEEEFYRTFIEKI